MFPAFLTAASYAAGSMSTASVPRIRALVPGLAAGLVVLLAACTASGRAAPGDGYTYSPPVVQYVPYSTTGPFVVVAVDNHFHDIHPTDPPTIAANRPFIVKNEGYNLHNFTVIGTHISIDIRPGHEFVWPTIGAHLKPGHYKIVCTYHLWAGMTGILNVSPPNSTPAGQGG